MENNRSNKFDSLTTKGNRNNQEKSLWKRIWFWLKIVIYVLTFGITMTGCVQTWAVKSSNYTGSGVELYLNKNSVSPYVNTFVVGKKPKGDSYLQEGEFYELKRDSEANFYLSENKYANVLEALRTQTLSNDGEYGKYNSYSSAIQFINKDGSFLQDNEPLIKENDKYLFATSNATKYSSIYTNFSDVKFLDPDFNIKNIFIENPDQKGTFTLKESALSINRPYIDDKKKTWEVKSASLFSVQNQYEESYNVNKNGNVTQYWMGPNKYNRDVFEFLYLKTFATNNIYSRVLNDSGYTTYSDWMNAIINKEVSSLNALQLETLSKYNATIQNYLTLTNLNNLDLDTYKVTAYEKTFADPEKQGSAFTFSKENSVVGSQKETVRLALVGDTPQKAITSWKDSWSLGPFFGLFVYPIAWVTSSIREPLPSLGGWTTIFAIIIAVIITRLIALAFTWKSTMNQSKQEELKTKKAKIDAKYADFQGNKQMKARQQQEVAALYKKNGINPLDTFATILISIPIFIAMWRVIQSTPSLKSTHWLGMDFSATSWKRLFYEGEFQYLGLLIITLAVQGISQFLPRLLNNKKNKRLTIVEKQAIKKANKTQNIVMIVFLVITVMFTAGVQIYWIFSSLWAIAQTLGIHYFKKSKYYKKKYLSKI
ncbi:membrane protein insertase YidC [Mycoplasmopsis gallinarum]|uniref:membrane protein insertase YidC n=1 Tax=Mycoplasmopsis gallinarum TaxID=29557 RepID=UPI000481A613|nr:membrane protein insertase YidC [Mycoplasmopsis gallinarum]